MGAPREEHGDRLGVSQESAIEDNADVQHGEYPPETDRGSLD